jgi:hypothetical protein
MSRVKPRKIKENAKKTGQTLAECGPWARATIMQGSRRNAGEPSSGQTECGTLRPVQRSCLVLKDAEKKKAKQRQVSAGCAVLSEPIPQSCEVPALWTQKNLLQARQSAVPYGPCNDHAGYLKDAEKDEANKSRGSRYGQGCSAKRRKG